MQKSLLFSLILCFLYATTGNTQVGGLLKKVKSSVTNELLGNTIDNQDNKSSKPAPEPPSACDQAELIMDLGGKLKIDYSELNISVLDDGRMLAQDRETGNYYIVKDGVAQGPYSAGDPKVAEFAATEDGDDSIEDILLKYKNYISRSGEKYLITFDGKSYGPFARIDRFAVTKSKNKFAALVVENTVVNEDQGKKMEEAMKNARSDQERMELAMKFSQQVADKMLQTGVNNSMPGLVTNIPDASYDPLIWIGGQLNDNLKYNDILVVTMEKIMDLQGKTILTLKQGDYVADELFVNTANTKYATYSYGTLNFSDNTAISELFNPHLINADGKIYLAYMYYSPKRNSIMRCKIPF